MKRRRAWHHKSQTILFAIERLDDDYIGVEGDAFLRERVGFAVDGDHTGGQFAFFDSEDDDERWGAQVIPVLSQGTTGGRPTFLCTSTTFANGLTTPSRS